MSGEGSGNDRLLISFLSTLYIYLLQLFQFVFQTNLFKLWTHLEFGGKNLNQRKLEINLFSRFVLIFSICWISSNNFKSSKLGFSSLSFSLLWSPLTHNQIFLHVIWQVGEAVVLACGALPSWCEDLTYATPMLFPFETRHLYFNCTAFGPERYSKLCYCYWGICNGLKCIFST